MFFESNKNIENIENKEWYHPITFQIEKIKTEKENLEEYARQLIFIEKILNHILWNNHIPENRRVFNLTTEFDKYYLVTALNALLHDCPSQIENFSKEEIENYIIKIRNELNLVEARIDYIWSQLRRYGEDK